jgi:hypothetical protein
VTKARLKQLLAEYGRVAVVTYLALFVLSLALFSLLFSFGLEAFVGFDAPDTLRGVGVLGAAYAATKVVQPLRIFATLGLTPIAARLLKRMSTVRN